MADSTRSFDEDGGCAGDDGDDGDAADDMFALGVSRPSRPSRGGESNPFSGGSRNRLPPFQLSTHSSY